MPLVGPRRLHPVPHGLDEVGRVDVVLISHDHYDHLDLPTVRALLRDQDAPFVVPLGVGAHLRHWNVPEARIIELDWHHYLEFSGLRLLGLCRRHLGLGFAFDLENDPALVRLAGYEDRAVLSALLQRLERFHVQAAA